MDRLVENLLCRALVPGSVFSVGSVGELLRFLLSLGKGRSREGADCFWGVEGVEGTDQLIERCKHLQRKGRGGILVKTCKPGQDQSLDLPTIGPDTVKNAAEAGLSGVIVHAGASLLVDSQESAKIADQHKIFVSGVKP